MILVAVVAKRQTLLHSWALNAAGAETCGFPECLIINNDLLLTGAGAAVSWGKDGSTMLNPTNGDPSHVVVNYVEEYLDLVESLPFDLQRSVSLMKEIDAKYQGKVR